MRTNTTNIELQSKLIELAKRQQDMLFKQQEQIDKLEERIAALEERLVIYESDEEQLESTDQERQEQIAFIREHTEWAINEAISWGEYLNNPLNEEQIAQLRKEGLALAERMINNEEYIDYSNSELKDCIEQSITCIKQGIRDKRR